MSVIHTAGRGHLQRNSFSITFTGAAGFGAAADVITAFTTTGEVLIAYLVPYVVSTLTQSGATPTLALGVVNSNALFIAATTATTLTTGEFWTEATGGGTAAAGVGLPAAGTAAPQLKDVVITSNVILTVGGTLNINGGTLRIDVYYLPLSSDGLLA